MRRFVLMGLVVVTPLLLTACGGGDGLPRQRIKGAVTLDGKAVTEGMITFEPAKAGDPVSSAVIVDGMYDIPRSDGPVPGTHKVSIWARAATGRKVKSPDDPSKEIDERLEVVPDKYNLQSELKAEVKDRGKNVFDFQLTGALPLDTKRR